MNNIVLRFAFALLLIAIMVGGVMWMITRQFRQSREDKAVIIVKWVLTLLLVATAVAALPLFHVFGLFLIVFCGLIFSTLWAPSIGDWLARPLTNALDGGIIPPDKRPFLSIAEAQRKRGNYAVAVAELHKQLELFPRDFETQLLLASIQAENLGDLESARTTIARLVNQTEHHPKNRAYALTQMADWELSRGLDPEAARQLFERIRELFPNTEQANLAAQRLAHLPEEPGESPRPTRPPVPLATTGDAGAAASYTHAEAEAGRLTRHLATHPLDAEARETLARLYVEDLSQPDLALQQLETMIAQPSQPPRQLARWLNQAADIQSRHLGDASAAQATLQRIIDLLPGTAFADAAASRQGMISVEQHAKQGNRTVKLGTYERDLGLKNPR
jgi:tetratricopeptide (TPR) repeat protein